MAHISRHDYIVDARHLMRAKLSHRRKLHYRQWSYNSHDLLLDLKQIYHQLSFIKNKEYFSSIKLGYHMLGKESGWKWLQFINVTWIKKRFIRRTDNRLVDVITEIAILSDLTCCTTRRCYYYLWIHRKLLWPLCLCTLVFSSLSRVL